MRTRRYIFTRCITQPFLTAKDFIAKNQILN